MQIKFGTDGWRDVSVLFEEIGMCAGAFEN